MKVLSENGVSKDVLALSKHVLESDLSILKFLNPDAFNGFDPSISLNIEVSNSDGFCKKCNGRIFNDIGMCPFCSEPVFPRLEHNPMKKKSNLSLSLKKDGKHKVQPFIVRSAVDEAELDDILPKMAEVNKVNVKDYYPSGKFQE